MAKPEEESSIAQGTEDLQVPLGQLLVHKGLANASDVEEAVQLQGQLATRGVFLRLGELLVARGHVDEGTVTEVLSLQGTSILICPECMSQYNVVAYQRHKRYRCSRCHEVLKLPEQIQALAVEDTLASSDMELDAYGLGQGREFGNYMILGEISRGGMGIIYKARQRGLDRIVAMKVLAQSEGVGPLAREEFTREARSVAKLRHPGIVAIHEVGRLGGIDYFTMEYVEGLQLQQAAAAEGLTAEEVVTVFLKLCDAVHYAHSQEILHRDLKPQNILLDRKRNPILIDFGVAGAEDAGELEEGTIVGSPAYLPPEYIAGTHHYDARGEVYALGATLYTLLGGRPPHSGIDTVQILRRANVERVIHLRSIRRTIDRGLATIVMTALARDAKSRYASAQEMGDDLRRWLQGEDVSGASSLTRTWNRIRGKVAATLGLALAFVLLTVSGISAWQVATLERKARETQAQHERQQGVLKDELTRLRLRHASLLLDAGEHQEAEALLSGLLRLGGPAAVARKAHSLRAEAREALDDPDGAAADREAAGER